MLQCRQVSKDQYDREQKLADKLNKEGVSNDDVETDGAEHPEGKKRGGVVEVYERDGLVVMWDDLDEEWVGYNNEDDEETKETDQGDRMTEQLMLEVLLEGLSICRQDMITFGDVRRLLKDRPDTQTIEEAYEQTKLD